MDIPDPAKIAQFKKNPEQGPGILFFSGGSALRKLCRQLINYTCNSIHIITAFDSGGSSAVLREAFGMPAIGDIRARLMDLADQGLKGNREIFELFAYRFSQKKTEHDLKRELDDMARGSHRLVSSIPEPWCEVVRMHLSWFQKHMPQDFDLHGASVGNLVLAAGYLENNRQLDPVISTFAKLVRVQGLVLPVVDKYLHLAAELNDGSILVGQHLMTGKEVSPIKSGVKRIFITDNRDTYPPVSIQAGAKVETSISRADLICYPMGSFYSSIIANLLVDGIGEAVSQSKVNKVYVPNTGKDPECLGHTLMDQIEVLISYASGGLKEKKYSVLDYVIIDQRNGQYAGQLDSKRLAELGVRVIDCELVSRESAPEIDEELLLPVLLSLA